MLKEAIEIIDTLTEDGLFEDVCIYVDNKRLSDTCRNSKKMKTPAGNVYYEEEGEFDPHDYFDFCNKDTISLSFEGPLYEVLNEDFDYFDKLNAIIKSKGLHFELGNAWNMSAYA